MIKTPHHSKFKVVLGVTGGIAAYKSAYLVRLLQNANCDVRVVMTPSAAKFVSPLTFEALSGKPVAIDDFTGSISHIELAKWADIVAIAPATANTIAKFAMGFADNLLTAIVLASNKPIALFPAMNTNMYLNEATKFNINTLKGRGFNVFEPMSGRLACGDEGAGKMAEPEDIVKSLMGLLTGLNEYEGIKILVTAGPTMEAVDPVRYITNRSSGKMGYAVAATAAKKGASVTLVSGPVCLPSPVKDIVHIKSSSDMLEIVYSLLPAYDILLMCAAVADYKPSAVAEQKIKKDEGVVTLELIKTDDILKTVSVQKRPYQVYVGFAAESENIQDNAMKKLLSKRLDMIVANDISRKDIGFNTDENEVVIYYDNSTNEFISKRSKAAVADIVVERAVARFKEKAKK